MHSNATFLDRRRLLWLAGAGVIVGSLFGCSSSQRSYRLSVSRDAGCECCHAWMMQMKRSGRFEMQKRDEPDMPGLKRRLGVPADLAACHTGEVETYVIEGNVPAEDILRLLAERRDGVRGLAVPAMPVGSRGMEQPDGARKPFEVFAFQAAGGRMEFARHG